MAHSIEALRGMGDLANLMALGTIIPLCVYFAFVQKSHAAKVFLFGWIALLLGVMIWLLKNHGIIDSNDFTKRAVLFGGAIEMIMVGLAVSMKVKENEVKLVIAENKVKELTNTKRLLRIVCHDIMNPMSIVLNASQIMRRKDNEKAWDMVARSGKMVVSIIDHVRKLEALQSGKHELNLNRCLLLKFLKS